jgi:hypothetical protein
MYYQSPTYLLIVIPTTYTKNTYILAYVSPITYLLPTQQTTTYPYIYVDLLINYQSQSTYNLVIIFLHTNFLHTYCQSTFTNFEPTYRSCTYIRTYLFITNHNLFIIPIYNLHAKVVKIDMMCYWFSHQCYDVLGCQVNHDNVDQMFL